MKSFQLLIIMTLIAHGEAINPEIRFAGAREFLKKCRCVFIVQPQAKELKDLIPVKGAKPSEFVATFAAALIEGAPRRRLSDGDFGGFVIYQKGDDEEGAIRTLIVNNDGTVRGQVFNLELLMKAGGNGQQKNIPNK